MSYDDIYENSDFIAYLNHKRNIDHFLICNLFWQLMHTVGLVLFTV